MCVRFESGERRLGLGALPHRRLRLGLGDSSVDARLMRGNQLWEGGDQRIHPAFQIGDSTLHVCFPACDALPQFLLAQ